MNSSERRPRVPQTNAWDSPAFAGNYIDSGELATELGVTPVYLRKLLNEIAEVESGERDGLSSAAEIIRPHLVGAVRATLWDRTGLLQLKEEWKHRRTSRGRRPGSKNRPKNDQKPGK